jgi:hypothetical protein
MFFCLLLNSYIWWLFKGVSSYIFINFISSWLIWSLHVSTLMSVKNVHFLSTNQNFSIYEWAHFSSTFSLSKLAIGISSWGVKTLIQLNRAQNIYIKVVICNKTISFSFLSLERNRWLEWHDYSTCRVVVPLEPEFQCKIHVIKVTWYSVCR